MIVELIDALHRQFGAGYTFYLDAITEGGIEMTQWPQRDSDEAYKTFRFKFPDPAGVWPRICAQTLDEWRAHEAGTIIWQPHDQKHIPQGVLEGGSYLKAFYGAPCWNKTELSKMVLALETIGIHSTKLPSNTKMKTSGRAMGHRKR